MRAFRSVPECPAGDKSAAIPFAVGLLCFQSGAIGLDLFQRLAVALPAVGLGTFIGTSMFAKVDDRVCRYSALFTILASGCLMVFSGTP